MKEKRKTIKINTTKKIIKTLEAAKNLAVFYYKYSIILQSPKRLNL
jgi:hypothetical protein